MEETNWQWLYLKIYGGYKGLELLLTESLYPYLKKLETTRFTFFFIRYHDPEFHIRLRFKIPACDFKKTEMELQSLLKPYQNEWLIYKTEKDLYIPETDRYGTQTMATTEELFNDDSFFVLTILSLLEEEEHQDKTRWLWALKSVDTYFTQFEYALHERIKLLNDIISGFKQEFNWDKSLKVQLDLKYRKEKQSIYGILTVPVQATNLDSCIKDRIRKQKNKINSLITFLPENLEKISKDDYLASILHMHINRLFLNQQRLTEYVLYEMLSRYYITQHSLTKNS